MAHYVPISETGGVVLSPTAWQQFTDFANVLKAFIGTSYLALPFAFKQSGLALGIVALVIIATITDHCCQMIIKCKKVAVTMILDSSHQYRQLKADHCHEEMQKIRMAVEMEMTLGDIGKIAIGDWGLRIVNVALVLTQTGFCVAYFIFMGNTIKSMFPYEFPSQNITKNASVQHLPKLSNFPVPISDESVKTITLNGTLLMDATHGQRSAPMFPLLLLIPLPFVVAMAFIRKIRKLGPISGLANIALLAGFFGLLVQILDGLHFKLNDVTLANWITFPIFFGQLTCAYEGIGCVSILRTFFSFIVWCWGVDTNRELTTRTASLTAHALRNITNFPLTSVTVRVEPETGKKAFWICCEGRQRRFFLAIRERLFRFDALWSMDINDDSGENGDN